MSTPKPIAVGLYCPAGVFTRGVLSAGCDVISSLHASPVSAAAHVLNYPDIPTVTKRSAWPLCDLAEQEIGLVYAQPPAIPEKRLAQASEEPSSDAVRIAASLRPLAFLMEGGGELWAPPVGHPLPGWEQLFEDSGYLTCRLRINWQQFGLPQNRRRTFFVAARVNLDFASLVAPAGAPSVDAAIGDLFAQPLADELADLVAYTEKPQNDFQKWCRRGCKQLTGHVDSPGASSVASLIPHLAPGQHVRQISDEIYRETYWKTRSKSTTVSGLGKPSMYYRRLHGARPASMVPGDIRFLHPEHDRYITPREAARLMGIPDCHLFAGSAARANLDAGRTVSPWVVEPVVRALLAHMNGTVPAREHQYQVEFKPATVNA
jgi:DNA (cytosine-5)-methyltransferase 1